MRLVRLKIFKLVMVIEAILLAISLLFGALEFSHKIHNKASLFADSIRNDYVLNDQKAILQKIQIATISHDFLDIEVTSKGQRRPKNSQLFTIENEISILSIPDQKQSAILGYITFSYSLLPGFLHGFIFWLLVTTILIILLPFLKSNLEEFLSKEMEVKKMRELNSIAARVAHDIRSPLTALNALIYGVSEITPEHKEIIGQVSARIQDIANDLLIKSKQQMPLNDSLLLATNKSSTLKELLEGISKEKSLEYQDKKNVSILLRVDSLDSAIKVSFPERDLSRILSNLINNSVEAIVENGNITIQAYVRNEQAIITIFDSGTGISEEVLSKLFMSEVTTKASGSGIGLSSAYAIARKNGGDLKVQSKVGVGTQVTLYLPLR